MKSIFYRSKDLSKGWNNRTWFVYTANLGRISELCLDMKTSAEIPHNKQKRHRPYRKGMSGDKALQVLQQMAQDSELDSNIVSTLKIHYDEINSIRIAAQASAFKEYQEFSLR